jgi:hypothetical protein
LRSVGASYLTSSSWPEPEHSSGDVPLVRCGLRTRLGQPTNTQALWRH